MLTEVPHGVLLANMSGLGLFKFSLSGIDLIIQFPALVEALDSASLVPLRGILLVCVHSLNRSISDLVEYLRGILSLPLLSIRGHNTLGLFQIDTHIVVRFESIHVRG